MRITLLIIFAGAICVGARPAYSQDREQSWLGNAPFCSGTPQDCRAASMTYVRSHPSGDGDTCLTGTKILCEGAAVRGQPIAASGGLVAACPSDALKIEVPLRCECTAKSTESGSVWGNLPYTADSRICRAAVHAGVIHKDGGVITVTPMAGQRYYNSSTAHGVRTKQWNAYDKSFYVSE